MELSSINDSPFVFIVLCLMVTVYFQKKMLTVSLMKCHGYQIFAEMTWLQYVFKITWLQYVFRNNMVTICIQNSVVMICIQK